MAKPKIRVNTACRDCQMCTGHAFTGAGRSIGRGAADVATLGLTHLARRTCKACSHPMSEHGGQNAQLVNLAAGQQTNSAGSYNPARWVLMTDGQHRWWDGEHWADFYSTVFPATQEQIDAAMASAADAPPRWKQQPDGRFRWWGGSAYSDEYTRDPVGEIEYAQAALPVGPSGGVDDLMKLVELHNAGALTEEEFAAAKKKMLGM